MGEEKTGIVADPKVKKYEKDTDCFAEGKVAHGVRNASAPDEFPVMEDLINGVDKLSAGSLNPFTIPGNGNLFYGKERDFYTDKSVIDCELPELVVFKGETYHVVKDICIDDGLSSLDKILVESSEELTKVDLENTGLDVNSDLTKKKDDGAASISNWWNPFLEYDCDTDVAKQFDSGKLTQNGEGDSHEIVGDVSDEKSIAKTLNWAQELDVGNSLDDVSDEKTVPETLDVAQDLEADNSLDDVSNAKARPIILHMAHELDAGKSVEDVSDEKAETLHSTEELDVGNSFEDVSEEKAMPQNVHPAQELGVINSPTSSNVNEDKNQQQPDQDADKETNSSNETISKNSIVSAGEESINCNQATEAPFSSKSGNGNNTVDSDSSPPATSGRQEETKDTNTQLPIQTLNMQSTEEEAIDSRTASSRSFFSQHGPGESSFSAVGPLSGPISYSGLIPYSGSISIRSDSSTTSTRSFAFPILNTEWNSSPVKMAKADKRLRKQRGWRMYLFCCRF